MPTWRQPSPETPRAAGASTSRTGAQIDALIALAMAVERAEQRPEPVRLLGWL
jgi:hypothetical protein